MSEQGDRGPPRWQAGSGTDSQLALEAVFRTAGQGSSSGPGPDRDDARARGRQLEIGERRPDTNPREPSWPAVMATTVGLWLQRRRARLGRLLQHRWVIVLTALAVTSLAVGGLAVTFTRQVGPTAPAPGQKAAHAGVLTGPTGQNSGALAASQSAAAWVAREVSRDAIVACDPSMRLVLQAQGFAAEDLLVLGPEATDLRFSDVIVATQAVRNLFGSRLQLVDAPAVIASFGSGEARVDIRAVAPDGAAAYRAALSADWTARRSAAAELVRNPRVHAAGAARQELLTGKADSRLLIMLAALAVSDPVNVVAFGGTAPRASAGVPMREMDISGTGSPAYHSAELQRMRSLVLAQRAVFRPGHVSLVRRASGGAALRIEFGAPSPLGLLLGSPVTQ